MAGEKLFDKLQRKVHTMKSKKNMKKTKKTKSKKRKAKETVGDSEETVRGDAGKKLELLDFSTFGQGGQQLIALSRGGERKKGGMAERGGD